MGIHEASEQAPAVDAVAAPAGLNLLGDVSAGACCGGGSCTIPG